jgi:ATP-binding cassette subfamily B (MDR/TAP) protein 1
MTMIAHLNAISVPLNAISNAVDAAAIFFTIIDAPKPTTTGIEGSAVALDKDLELRRINFTYPSRLNVRVLQDFDLTIPSGKTTAIVGPSGSGKSEKTLIPVLLACTDCTSLAQRYSSCTHIKVV